MELSSVKAPREISALRNLLKFSLKSDSGQFLWGFFVFEINVYFLLVGYAFLYSVIPVSYIIEIF